ncbi:MAG: (2Fe-2S)-binding protein [Candidatus Limnocylindria bacterium]
MPGEVVTVALVVNGRPHDVDVPAHHSLLDVLREQLRLTGAKECCAEGECGACTVIVDGEALNACLVLAVEMDGHEVTTIEGLADDGRLSPVQDAFLSHGAVQCGFCIPGMVMSATYLLATHPAPSMDDIREGLSGNLCRCGGYNQICDAVADAARRRSPGSQP